MRPISDNSGSSRKSTIPANGKLQFVGKPTCDAGSRITFGS